ncbi:hypothetical protein FHX42_001508 [Saccharopolyspora lacisalsi]|uniref:Tyr recombinase domain-containing protein n=1 Tax=Halosaccharopolyspora lacisalsi TaxID=1000566 RepID=A0A839DTU4_9PSEU|nr:tyrosine-type recombinase/integrase [Halosaccharopolyspora lacisalsi]MBA8824179.1 hypothetical protein [Halosaccharopolyspora lacisalsi]
MLTEYRARPARADLSGDAPTPPGFLDWLSSSAEPSAGGDPLTEARARDIAVAAGLVHDTGTEAGEARAHHHTLRRTSGAQLLRNGVDKVTVADLTGHTTPRKPPRRHPLRDRPRQQPRTDHRREAPHASTPPRTNRPPPHHAAGSYA